MSGEFFLVGRVRRAHGIRGELVIETLTDAPDAFFAPGRRVFVGTADGTPSRDQGELRVIRSSPFKGGLIVAFEGIADRSTAERWRERTLLVPAAEIEPPSDDEVFIHDLVGMHVLLSSGEPLGEVTEVFELPQGLLFEVQRPDAKPVLLPFNEQTVTDVDSTARVIRVDPVEGLID